MQGGGARVGNIGKGPDGHVLDKYQVPCPEGSLILFVDGYHCPGADRYPANRALSEAERADMLARIRAARVNPTSNDSMATIFDVVQWAQATSEIHLAMCMSDVAMLKPEGYENWRFMLAYYTLGLTEHALVNPNETYAENQAGGIASAIDAYRVMVATIPSLSHPQLDRLAGRSPEALRDEAKKAAAGCTTR